MTTTTQARPARFAAVAVLALALALPCAARAENGWVLGAGAFDIGQTETQWELGLEHRFASFELFSWLPLTPAVGVSVTDRESFYVYTGFRYDWHIGEKWVATPHFAAGFYEQGDGKDLGGEIEFRSGLEITRKLKNGGRIGVTFYHLSHANIYDDNPGAESLLFVWSGGR